MTKVFIGGSRRISRLNKYIRDRVDNIIQNGYTVLIGDANGVDKSVQNYLFNKNYRNVLVFCTGNKCRNNIGNWQIKNIEVAKNRRDFHYYSIKDSEMVKETDFGFMIWDAKSKGTVNNIVNLLKESKKILVYFSPGKNFYTLTTFHDLEKLLAKCDGKSLEIFEREFRISQILKQERDQRALNSPNKLVKLTQLTLL